MAPRLEKDTSEARTEKWIMGKKIWTGTVDIPNDFGNETK